VDAYQALARLSNRVQELAVCYGFWEGALVRERDVAVLWHAMATPDCCVERLRFEIPEYSIPHETGA